MHTISKVRKKCISYPKCGANAYHDHKRLCQLGMQHVASISHQVTLILVPKHVSVTWLRPWEPTIATFTDKHTTYTRVESAILVREAEHPYQLALMHTLIPSLQRRCESAGCERQPSFGNISEGVAKFCRDHRRVGDQDVRHPRCQNASCGKIPLFGQVCVSFFVCAPACCVCMYVSMCASTWSDKRFICEV